MITRGAEVVAVLTEGQSNSPWEQSKSGEGNQDSQEYTYSGESAVMRQVPA